MSKLRGQLKLYKDKKHEFLLPRASTRLQRARANRGAGNGVFTQVKHAAVLILCFPRFFAASTLTLVDRTGGKQTARVWLLRVARFFLLLSACFSRRARAQRMRNCGDRRKFLNVLHNARAQRFRRVSLSKTSFIISDDIYISQSGKRCSDTCSIIKNRL